MPGVLELRQGPLLVMPHSTADPVFQLAATLVAGGDAKVVDPATKVLADPEELVVHRHAPVPVRQYPDALLELMQRVRVPMDLGSLEGKAQELTFIGSDHSALGRVDRQFQAMLQVVADAGFEDALHTSLLTSAQSPVELPPSALSVSTSFARNRRWQRLRPGLIDQWPDW